MTGSYGKWLVKKCIRACFLVMAVSIVTFILMKVSPTDPLQTNVGQAALGTMSREQVEKLEIYWGVGVSPVKQYLSWASDFLRGDMGTSLLYRQPVKDVVAERFLNSLMLMVSSWIISGGLGLFLGILAGMNHGKAVDRIVKGYCLLISATPTFWLAMLLLMVFGVWLGILPVGFSVPAGVEAGSVTAADRIQHVILPAAALSITGVSNIALHTREKMIEIMESDYVLFARARGETAWEILKNHGLRNVLLPAVTLHFSTVSEIFGGAVLTEQVFSYPGLGQAAVTAGLGSDMPLLMAVSMISALFVFGGNLAADILSGIIDPRIRRGGGSR